jgi:hypothetical protein
LQMASPAAGARTEALRRRMLTQIVRVVTAA